MSHFYGLSIECRILLPPPRSHTCGGLPLSGEFCLPLYNQKSFKSSLMHAEAECPENGGKVDVADPFLPLCIELPLHRLMAAIQGSAGPGGVRTAVPSDLQTPVLRHHRHRL